MKLFPLILPAFLFIACQKNSELVAPLYQNIFVEVRDLQPLTSIEGHYEAWMGFADPFGPKTERVASADSTLVSIGSFMVDSAHHLVGLDGQPFVPRLSKGRIMQYAIDAFISIEPPSDSDDAPDSLIIGGEFTGNLHVGTARLSASYREIEDSHTSATATVTIYR